MPVRHVSGDAKQADGQGHTQGAQEGVQAAGRSGESSVDIWHMQSGLDAVSKGRSVERKGQRPQD